MPRRRGLDVAPLISRKGGDHAGTCDAVDVLQETSILLQAGDQNTDQSGQFTAHEFVQAVKERRCKISIRMYLYSYDSVTEVRRLIMNTWIDTTDTGYIESGKGSAVMLPTVELILRISRDSTKNIQVAVQTTRTTSQGH